MSAISLLRSSRDFRAAFLSRVVSELGTWFAYVALTVAVYDLTGSARWVSALLLLDVVPALAVGTLAARRLDRVVRKHVLVGAELAGGAAFCGLALAGSLGALFALAAVAGVASALFKPSIRAAMPSLVEDDELPRANALMRTAAASAILGAAPLAGVLVAAGGPRPILAANALSFLASAILISRIPRERLQQAGPARRATLSRSARALYRAPAPRSVLASWTLAQLTWAAVNVSEVIVARTVFHTGAAGFGLLAACSGAGLLAGSAAAGRLADRAPLGLLYRNALVLAALGLAVGATAPRFALLLVGAAICGAGNALALSFADLTLQREIPGERLGQAFGVFQACATGAGVVGMISAGAFIDALGGRAAWGAAAAVALAAAGLAAALAREPRLRPVPLEP